VGVFSGLGGGGGDRKTKNFKFGIRPSVHPFICPSCRWGNSSLPRKIQERSGNLSAINRNNDSLSSAGSFKLLAGLLLISLPTWLLACSLFFPGSVYCCDADYDYDDSDDRGALLIFPDR
jgi:hypothetical protein